MGLATAIQQLRAVVRDSGSCSRILTEADVEALREVLAAHAPPSKAEDAAMMELADAARDFGRLTPRRQATGSYGRALRQLVNVAQKMGAMGDLAWAAEVAELRDQVDDLFQLLYRAQFVLINQRVGGAEKLTAEIAPTLDRHLAGGSPVPATRETGA